jgi:hypothetical protein
MIGTVTDRRGPNRRQQLTHIQLTRPEQAPERPVTRPGSRLSVRPAIGRSSRPSAGLRARPATGPGRWLAARPGRVVAVRQRAACSGWYGAVFLVWHRITSRVTVFDNSSGDH